jgi:hypothetical protein
MVMLFYGLITLATYLPDHRYTIRRILRQRPSALANAGKRFRASLACLFIFDNSFEDGHDIGAEGLALRPRKLAKLLIEMIWYFEMKSRHGAYANFFGESMQAPI